MNACAGVDLSPQGGAHPGCAHQGTGGVEEVDFFDVVCEECDGVGCAGVVVMAPAAGDLTRLRGGRFDVVLNGCWGAGRVGPELVFWAVECAADGGAVAWVGVRPLIQRSAVLASTPMMSANSSTVSPAWVRAVLRCSFGIDQRFRGLLRNCGSAGILPESS